MNDNWRSVLEVHTDRHERQWKHVSVDFSSFSIGVTAMAVSVCGETVVTKVSLVFCPPDSRMIRAGGYYLVKICSINKPQEMRM